MEVHSVGPTHHIGVKDDDVMMTNCIVSMTLQVCYGSERAGA